jgi:myo-inositol-1(or 4)-monophosphatase
MAFDRSLIHHAATIAHRAADAAARIHRAHAGAVGRIDTKSTATDLVTEIDRAAEVAIRGIIQSAFPDHGILGEEGGDAAGGDARYQWIVDPLDGTVNYAHGFPCYAVSIALEIDGVPAVGVVLDSARDERFAAIAGHGATRDGAPIRVSDTRSVAEAMVGTGFAYGGPAVAENLALFARVLPRVRAVRRPGSAALDLCSVACGRYDAFWELDLNAWDVAAGRLIVEEAGGTITNLSGAPYRHSDAALLASNGALHGAMLALLGSASSA